MGRCIVSSLLICCFITDVRGSSVEWDWLDQVDLLNQSSLDFKLAVDDADGWSRQFELTLAGPLYSLFELSYGESYLESDDANMQTDFYSLGFRTDPLSDVSLSAGYEEWGDEEALTIETLWLGFTLNRGDLSVTLMPQQRDIRLQVTEWFQRYANHIDLESHDVGLMLSYFLDEGWVVSGSYFNYDYSRNLSRLDENYRAIFIFPLDTLELASGLDDYRYSIGIGKLVGEVNLNLDWSRARSAVDGNFTSLTSLSAEYPLNETFSLNLMGGVQDVDYAEEKILFFNLGLSLSW
jgi:hypothetical protein